LHANVSAFETKTVFDEIVLKHCWCINPPPPRGGPVAAAFGRFVMPIFDEIGRFGTALKKARLSGKRAATARRSAT
jgi:hypothetical protein